MTELDDGDWECGCEWMEGTCSECVRRYEDEIESLRAALLKVKESAEDDGWCPICDEHSCRKGYCILADLEADDE